MANVVLMLAERGFGWNIVRSIFATLDSVIYYAFAMVMGLMFDIAEVTANPALSDFIDPLYNRVYAILSIYMLFKVTISFITYVVNPDAMTDKSKGVGKLVQRIIVALIMLLFCPIAFRTANELQAHIIEAGTVQKIVLGANGSFSNPSGIGAEIAYDIYNGTFIYYEETKEPVSDADVPIHEVEELTKVVNDPDDNDKSTYKYGYIPLLGFAVGLLLVVLTLSMCIDVAMRVFKLIILQVIAPIPILSYIDPNAKDSAFSKWIKMVGTVWAEVFIRLFIIYFIILAIKQFVNNGLDTFNGTSVFVKIALVIGLLFFAKDAPKFISDALGIKMPERGLFSGMGNIIAAGAIAGGAVGGMIGLGYANATRPIDETNGRTRALSYARNIGGALFGGVSGAVGGFATGTWAAGTAKDHAAKAALDARNKYMANSLTGNNLGARASRMGQNLLLGYDIDREISRNQAIESTAKDLREYSANEGAKVFSDIAQDLNFTNATGHRFDFNSSMDDLQQAYSFGATTGDYVLTDIHGIGQHLSKSEMDKLMGDASDGMGNMLMDAVDGTDRGADANYNYADVAAAYAAKTSQTKRDVHSSNISSKRSSYGGSARLSDSQTRNERAATIKGRQYGASNEAARLKVIKGDRK